MSAWERQAEKSVNERAREMGGGGVVQNNAQFLYCEPVKPDKLNKFNLHSAHRH